jgi:3-hydroxyacyl-CoA dehydrogenase
MRWGYNWELGPFETWDALGFVETTERMKKDGIALPDSIQKMVDSGATSFYSDDGKVFDLSKGEYVALERDPRTAPLAMVREGQSAVLSNDGAEAWDLGDGVLGLTFKTKANSLDDDVITMLNQAVEEAERNYESLLIYNEGDHFSVGANLFAIVMAANNKQWDQLDEVVKELQDVAQRMKYSKIPVVAAPWGMTLGGGLEVCLACDAVQASAETYAGLVEVGVGVIPGGGGNMNLLWRALEGIPEGAQINTLELVTNTFKNIAMAKVATSAVEAKHFGYFRHGDGVSFDKARLLHEAKQKAIGLARSDYHPPIPRAHVLPGESGIATMEMMVSTLVDGGYATEHDAFIAKKLARVLCGGASGGSHPVTEQEVLDLAREAFVSLCGEQKSLDRMQHMLMNNKPLRN